MKGIGAETLELMKGLGKRGLVLTSSGASQPQLFFETLASLESGPETQVENALGLFPNAWMTARYSRHMENRFEMQGRHISFGLGPADFEPWRWGLSELEVVETRLIADSFSSGRPFSILCICAAGVDNLGNINFGLNVDISLDLLAKAQELGARVVFEINDKLPKTAGESSCRSELADEIYHCSRAVPEFRFPRRGPVEDEICKAASALISDGNTLSCGLGSLVEGTLERLAPRKNLGVYTEHFGGAMAKLQGGGAINNRRKGFMEGQSLTTYCLGDKELHRFVNERPDVHLSSASFLMDQANIRRNRNLVALSQIAQIDLSGQASFTAPGSDLSWGMGLMPVIHREACGGGVGRSIVLMRSRLRGDMESAIVPVLPARHRVFMGAGEIDQVVTEYGVADLHLGGARERAYALVSIAHPDHRAALLQSAHEQGLL